MGGTYRAGREPNMPESEMKELRELLTEIKMTVTRLDAELRNIGKMESKVDKIDDVANAANQRSMTNEKNIEGLKAVLQWAIGIGLTSIGLIVTIILALLN